MKTNKDNNNTNYNGNNKKIKKKKSEKRREEKRGKQLKNAFNENQEDFFNNRMCKLPIKILQ